jgi:type IV pilus assembly protein PilF
MKKLLIILTLLLSACVNSQALLSVSNESSKQESARILVEQGTSYYQQGQMTMALEAFLKSTEFDPSYSSGFNGLAMSYAALNEDVKAEANFKRAIALDSKSSEAHNNFGSFLCSRNRIDESIYYFQEAVKNPLYTTPFVALTNAGYCSLKKSDLPGAERFFSLAIQYQPLLHNVSYQLAKIYFDKGQYELAQHLMINAMANNPSPEMLWLGVKIEDKLGNKDVASDYALELKMRFPDAPQTQSSLSGS